MSKKLHIGICTLFLILFPSAITRRDTQGDLDATFGFSGKVITPSGTNGRSSARWIAVQADGKSVVVGNPLIGTDPNTRNEDFAAVTKDTCQPTSNDFWY